MNRNGALTGNIATTHSTGTGRASSRGRIRQAALGGAARHIRWDSSAVEACGQVLDSKEAKNRTSDRFGENSL